MAIWNPEMFLAMNPEDEDSDDESHEDSEADSDVYTIGEDESGQEREVERLSQGSDSSGESFPTDNEGRSASVDVRGHQVISRGELPAS